MLVLGQDPYPNVGVVKCRRVTSYIGWVCSGAQAWNLFLGALICSLLPRQFPVGPSSRLVARCSAGSGAQLPQPQNAPSVGSSQVPGNSFPLSPVASPSADPLKAILEQLAATTQLLSNIVLNQQAQAAASSVAATRSVSTSGFSDANTTLNRPETFGSLSHEGLDACL